MGGRLSMVARAEGPRWLTWAIGDMGTETCREFARNGANVALLDVFGDKTRAAATPLL